MMQNITAVILAILTTCSAIMMYFVIPLIREKLSLAQRESLFKAVEIACRCADQLVNNGVLDKIYRHEHVIKYLNDRGYTYDVEEVNEMIESIVLTLPPLLISDKPSENTTDSIPEIKAGR